MDEIVSEHAARVSAYATVGARLSLFSDRRLGDAVAAAPSLGSGIGGRSAEMEVEGIRVFVKRVPLTDIELRPEHLRSTANLFELPLFYQYGAGSAGFGAWRELAAQIMTTGWVLKNEYAGFPLLYHWRVLPDSPPRGFVDALGGVEGAVARWDGSQAVRRRLEAIGRSSFSLVLFLEHVPQTLAAWLGGTRDAASLESRCDSSYRWAEAALMLGTEFMSARGLVHFDAHFANLLTDGRQVYFADFGLALSRDFDLSAEEDAFLADHLVYDRSYAPGHLLRHHLPDDVRGGNDHGTFLRAWVEGRRPDGVPPEIGVIIDRHAPHAIVLDDFHHRFLTQSKRTPFPAAEVRQALTSTSASG
ncbi:protein kinase family protein [Streptomyces sp. NPDC086549]|uniref:protein kinase family protein n=1 Tax=Streptomyces sp. NPDC086549 TaxID=3365752 RepID=UPI00380FDEE0